jgi:hypothetical protein
VVTKEIDSNTEILKERIYTRRDFLGVAAMRIVGAEFVVIGSADAQPSAMTPTGLSTVAIALLNV